MINKRQRRLLSETDSEFEKAKFSLLKASIYLEEVDEHVFKNTITEIEKVIKDLNGSCEKLIDFINEQDFPKSTQ